MKKIEINLKKIDPRHVEIIVSFLKEERILVYPTDTIYGIGAIADSVKAIKKINHIKKRADRKPLLILVADINMAKKYSYINKRQEKYLKKIWPGPVTVVLKKRDNLPEELTCGLDSIAIRLPKNNFLIKIIEEVGKPIISTSLNISKNKNLEEVKKIGRKFTKDLIDLVIDVGKLSGKPSRIIDLKNPNNIILIRK